MSVFPNRFPMLRSIWKVLAVLGILVAIPHCSENTIDSDTFFLDTNVEPLTEGDWPAVHSSDTWYWQLQGEVDLDHNVDWYDIDLFDSSLATISQLQNSGVRVICYFSAGSAENWRKDFAQFDKADLGKKLDGWEGERWLDIRSQNVWNILLSRLDLAKTKGCDGVEPDNVDAYLNDSGFHLTAEQQLTFNRHLANAAHERGLSVGLKNDVEQAGELVEYFDFTLNEQCHEYDEYELLQPFLDTGKAVFNAEYAQTASEAKELSATLCPKSTKMGLRTLILPLELDGSFHVSCDEIALP